MEKDLTDQFLTLYRADDKAEYQAYTWPAVRGCQVVDVVAVEPEPGGDASRPAPSADRDPLVTWVAGVIRQRHVVVWVN